VNAALKDLSQVTGNGSASLALVKSGAGTLTLTGPNTYTGGTTVSQGILNLSAGTLGVVILPAGTLTISNATVLMNAYQGQINAASAVTLNNSATLTLVGSNTLTSVAFNNYGSSFTPTLNTGGTLSLTSNTPLTVTSQDASFVPLITGTLQLGVSGVNTLSIGAIQIDSRTYTNTANSAAISAAIYGTGSSLLKTGAGILQLSSGLSNFAGGLTVSAGGLDIGASSSGTAVGAAVVSGPVGTGTLRLGDGVSLSASATYTLANNYTLGGTLYLKRNTRELDFTGARDLQTLLSDIEAL
jgi:autotransporter-associated beta strand protein